MFKDNKGNDFSWLSDFRKEHLKKSSRNPGLAALMSFVIMGLGQIYAGHIDRGIILLSYHIFSILCGYSLYNGGLIYKWANTIMSPSMIVLVTYLFSVIYILTWIYNVKDAYYLSIFSSFRDWFEVERVLLPSMGVPANMLISNTNTMNILEDKTDIKSSTVDISNSKDMNNETIINITPTESDNNKENTTQESDKNDFITSETDDLVYMNSNSWKSYWALLIFIILGFGTSLGYYYHKNKEQTSFQLTRNFDIYSPRTQKSEKKPTTTPIAERTSDKQQSNATDEKQSTNLTQQQMEAYVDQRIQKLNETDNKQQATNITQQQLEAYVDQKLLKINETDANKPSANLTQQQIEAYVDQRIQKLLAMRNQRNSSVSNYPQSYNSPLIVSADVNDNNNDFNNYYEDRSIVPQQDNSSNQVVFIQGHKEATVITKSNNQESENKSSSVVLYEAPEQDENDDVELVLTDEGGLNKTDSNEPIKPAILPINQVETNHTVPNVEQKTIDRLKEEEKAQKLAAKEEETENKGKVLFEKVDDDLPKTTNNTKEIAKKPLASEPNNSKSVVEKKPEPKITFESLEIKNKLEKIKEKGAQEFYQGNWEAALPFYFEVLKYRRNAESFEMVGIIFEKMNKLPDAFEAYENAYSLGLDSNHNLARLGLIAEKIGNYEKAQKYLEKAIERNPKRADIILSYARCLNKQGESLAAAQVLAVLRDNTNSYAIKKAAEQEYLKISKQNEAEAIEPEANNKDIVESNKE